MEACDFKESMSISISSIEHMCRTLVLHCLRTYHGDDKLREFIWELISVPYDKRATDDDQLEQDSDGESTSPVKSRKKNARKKGDLFINCLPLTPIAASAQRSGTRKSKRSAVIDSHIDQETNDTNETVMDKYHRGWAALPIYNPPALAVDDTYQRHLARHANKFVLSTLKT